MVGSYGTVLAHQGGWDEMLLVALPIALFVALLGIANARAGRPDGATDEPSDPSDPSDPSQPAQTDERVEPER